MPQVGRAVEDPAADRPGVHRWGGLGHPRQWSPHRSRDQPVLRRRPSRRSRSSGHAL